MNDLRSYMLRGAEQIDPCSEMHDAIDGSSGFRSDRQRRIFEWHIGSCPTCSRYWREYQQSLAREGRRNGSRQETETHRLRAPGAEPLLSSAGYSRGKDFSLVAASPLFRGLPPDELEGIFAEGQVLEVDSGTLVIEEDKVNSSLYVVLGGEFKVSLPAGPQRYGEVELARRRPPDCFGEYAFIDYKLASANVAALTQGRLFKIDFEVVDQFIDSDPELGRALYENVLLLVVARLRAEDTELDVFKAG